MSENGIFNLLQKKVNGSIFRILLASSILQSSCQHNSILHMGHNFSTPTHQSPISTDKVDDSPLTEFEGPQLIKYVANSVASRDKGAIFQINSYRFIHRFLYISSQLRDELLGIADMLTVNRPHLINAIVKIAYRTLKVAEEIENDHINFINKKITKRDLEKAMLEAQESFSNQVEAYANESADPTLA